MFHIEQDRSDDIEVACEPPPTATFQPQLNFTKSLQYLNDILPVFKSFRFSAVTISVQAGYRFRSAFKSNNGMGMRFYPFWETLDDEVIHDSGHFERCRMERGAFNVEEATHFEVTIFDNSDNQMITSCMVSLSCWSCYTEKQNGGCDKSKPHSMYFVPKAAVQILLKDAALNKENTSCCL